MEISQKRGSRSTLNVFHNDCVDFAWNDGTQSYSFSAAYTNVTSDRQTFIRRQAWMGGRLEGCRPSIDIVAM